MNFDAEESSHMAGHKAKTRDVTKLDDIKKYRCSKCRREYGAYDIIDHMLCCYSPNKINLKCTHCTHVENTFVHLRHHIFVNHIFIRRRRRMLLEDTIRTSIMPLLFPNEHIASSSKISMPRLSLCKCEDCVLSRKKPRRKQDQEMPDKLLPSRQVQEMPVKRLSRERKLRRLIKDYEDQLKVCPDDDKVDKCVNTKQ